MNIREVEQYVSLFIGDQCTANRQMYRLCVAYVAHTNSCRIDKICDCLDITEAQAMELVDESKRRAHDDLDPECFADHVACIMDLYRRDQTIRKGSLRDTLARKRNH